MTLTKEQTEALLFLLGTGRWTMGIEQMAQTVRLANDIANLARQESTDNGEPAT
jgi:hypothetical protein